MVAESLFGKNNSLTWKEHHMEARRINSASWPFGFLSSFFADSLYSGNHLDEGLFHIEYQDLPICCGQVATFGLSTFCATYSVIPPYRPATSLLLLFHLITSHSDFAYSSRTFITTLKSFFVKMESGAPSIPPRQYSLLDTKAESPAQPTHTSPVVDAEIQPSIVPTRTSSKRPNREDLVRDQQELDRDRTASVERLRVSSCSTEYWIDVKKIKENELQSVRLQRSISMLDMHMNEDEQASIDQWKAIPQGQAMVIKENVLKTQLKILEGHKEKAEAQEQEQKKNSASSVSKAFFVNFISSPLGLNIKGVLRQNRSRKLQQQFADELMEKMDSRHENPQCEDCWCPIMGRYAEVTLAGHLFPVVHGDDNMTAIFGPAELDRVIGKPESGKSELFRAVNGIYWSKKAELRFSEGMFVIVPDLDDNAPIDEAKAWQTMAIKEYKIKVLKPDCREMKNQIDANGDPTRTWASRDGQRIKWKSDFRPRARYLYWAYISTMFKLSFQDKKAQVDNPAKIFGKRFWGTAGSYIKKSQLQGFVRALGAEYEPVLDGAIEDDGDDKGKDDFPDRLPLLICDEPLKAPDKTQEEDSSEEENSSEEEDSGEDKDSGEDEDSSENECY